MTRIHNYVNLDLAANTFLFVEFLLQSYQIRRNFQQKVTTYSVQINDDFCNKDSGMVLTKEQFAKMIDISLVQAKSGQKDVEAVVNAVLEH